MKIYSGYSDTVGPACLFGYDGSLDSADNGDGNGNVAIGNTKVYLSLCFSVVFISFFTFIGGFLV